jgi:predicted esterase
LASLVKGSDPVNQPLAIWSDKHILVLSGGQDPVVPFKEGGTEAFVDKLKSSQAVAKIDLLVDEAAKHQTTMKMLDRLVEWLWEEVLLLESGEKHKM